MARPGFILQSDPNIIYLMTEFRRWYVFHSMIGENWEMVMTILTLTLDPLL